MVTVVLPGFQKVVGVGFLFAITQMFALLALFSLQGHHIRTEVLPLPVSHLSAVGKLCLLERLFLASVPLDVRQTET